MNGMPHESAIEAAGTARYRALMTTKKPDVAGAVAAMRAAPARGRGRKSPAYQWLHERRDALAKAFSESPPAWAAFAKYLGDNGIFGADGKPPTASAVRGAWLRIAAGAAGRRTAGPGAGTAAIELPPSMGPLPAFPPSGPARPAGPRDPARERFRERFKAAAVRNVKPEE
jgi:hypothetical protein